jgi:BirA family biotin operon repressor/biotin-[acetyl-CoA-carboxylase] ligase
LTGFVRQGWHIAPWVSEAAGVPGEQAHEQRARTSEPRMSLVSRDPAWAALADWLQQQLDAACPGIVVEFADELASTNSELLERARRGDATPRLLMARIQTAGRGRQGKAWWSEPDASLTFSLALPLQPADWSGLSLAAGLAVAESFAPEIGPELGLKWPNDLWLRNGPDDPSPGRKLGGILIETSQLPGPAPAGSAAGARLAVVGVGLNIRPPSAPPDAQQFRSGFACVQERLGTASAPTVLQRVAPALLRGVLAFQREGFAPAHPRYVPRDILAGRPVRVGDLYGRAQGVDAQGRLLVHTEAGLRAVASGEVSVWPC